MLTILAFVVVIGVLIFVHELGHFVTAKMVDIEVPRFSIGFGPKLIGFRRGETEYVISALPLGGYVKMAGMEEMEAIEGGVGEKPGESNVEPGSPRPRRPRDFESKSLPARTLVISAGVLMNVLFALAVFTVGAAVWGVTADPGSTIARVAEDRLPPGAEALTTVPPGAHVVAINDRQVDSWRRLTLELTRARAGETRLSFDNAQPITFVLPAVDSLRAQLIGAIEPAVPPILSHVYAGSPAAAAGLRKGDQIVEASGRQITTWTQLVTVISESPGQPLAVVVARDDERQQLSVTPSDTVLENGTHIGRIGVRGPDRTRPTPLQAAERGVEQTWDVIVLTIDFLAGLFTGRQSPRNVGSVITIGQLSGQFARAGLEEFLGFMAILSINLAILNLLPIPVLDGGHLVFLGIEAVRGRPLSLQQRMRLTQVGFVFIILLMAWALGNDILRTFGI